MGEIRFPKPVKLFIGLLSPETELFEVVRKEMEKEYGPVDHESPVFPWGQSRYYEKEMGPGLKRKFLFFEAGIPPDRLPSVKRRTQDLELSLADRKSPTAIRRRINIDPGYLDPAKVVLASTKNFSHRIYLGEGIYGEVTLFFKDRSYRDFPYTFPDFKTRRYIDLFNRVRETLFHTPSDNTPGSPRT